MWEVRIEERNAWRVKSKEKVGIAYVALSVWVQQSGCQKEGENMMNKGTNRIQLQSRPVLFSYQ